MPAGRTKRPCLGLPGRPCRSYGFGSASRCATCAYEYERIREAERAERRATDEPWRIIYGLAEWRKARAARLKLDDRRCVDCGSRQGLSVDHTKPLRYLWKLTVEFADDLDDFIARATKLDDLRTRCASCHKLADNARDE